MKSINYEVPVLCNFLDSFPTILSMVSIFFMSLIVSFACVSLLNLTQLTHFQENGCELHATGSHNKFVLSNIVSAIPTCLSRSLLRCELTRSGY
jgi:hypothetical protein